MPSFSNRPLGELELAVMEVLWQRSSGNVRDVMQALEARNLAYTTVMTTLDRLFKKGLLKREKESHAFLYVPAMTRDAYERQLVAVVLGSLPTSSREALLSGMLDFATADHATLDELERLIEARKRGGRP